MKKLFLKLLWVVSNAATDMTLAIAGNQSARIRFRKSMNGIIRIARELKALVQDYQKGGSDASEEKH